MVDILYVAFQKSWESAIRIGMRLHVLVAKFKLLALNPNKQSTNVEAERVS